MTKARQRERKLKKQWAGDLFPSGQHIYDAKQRRWFISEWERRRSELDHMRLAVKFGEKDEYFMRNTKRFGGSSGSPGSTRKTVISTQSKRSLRSSTTPMRPAEYRFNRRDIG